MPVLSCGGENFLVEVDGPETAPALLFSNSLSCDIGMWDQQVATLSNRFRVVRYNGRGQTGSVQVAGDSPEQLRGTAATTMERLGLDALAILDAVGITRAHVCGLSMGGMVAMWLLCNAPDRVSRTVLANTSAHMPTASMWDERIALARAGGMEATVEPTVTRWFPPDFRAHASGVVDRARAMIRATPVDGYAACCAAIRDMDQRDAIRAVTAPVMVLVGARDPATTPAAGQQIHKAIAGSVIATLNCGHISAMEQPDAFSELVGRFLAD